MAEDQRSLPRPSPMMDPAMEASSGAPMPGAVAGRNPQNFQTHTMSDFVQRVEEFKSTIPDSVANFYLQQGGFDCQDPKITRLVALAAQKFVADIANDALAHCRVSQAAKAPSGGGAGANKGQANKLTLTMEHLEAALSERGIKINKPPYYV